LAVLRFHRDKRGYEYYSLVEPSANRKGKGKEKARGRVLYWFRTPPHVKLGREPFDEELRRTLEAEYPSVRFDWPRILATPIPSAEDEMWRERRRAAKAAKLAAREESDEAEVSEEPEETDGLSEAEPEGEAGPASGEPAAAASNQDVEQTEEMAPVKSAEGEPASNPAASTTERSARRSERRRRGRRGGRPGPPAGGTGTV
jgi:hypothetical protein